MHLFLFVDRKQDNLNNADSFVILGTDGFVGKMHKGEWNQISIHYINNRQIVTRIDRYASQKAGVLHYNQKWKWNLKSHLNWYNIFMEILFMQKKANKANCLYKNIIFHSSDYY